MTYNVSSGTLNHTEPLVDQPLCVVFTNAASAGDIAENFTGILGGHLLS